MLLFFSMEEFNCKLCPRDDLNLDDAKMTGSEDQWFSKEKLYKVGRLHITGVLEKVSSIEYQNLRVNSIKKSLCTLHSTNWKIKG